MVTTEHGAYFAAFNGSAPVHPTCGPSCSAQGVWYVPNGEAWYDGETLVHGRIDPPQLLSTTLLYPRALVAAQNRVCMVVDAYSASGTTEVSVACASGKDLALVSTGLRPTVIHEGRADEGRSLGWVQDLLVDGEHVWFKSQPPDGSSFYPPGGVLWRADPMELTANLISRRSDSSASPRR